MEEKIIKKDKLSEFIQELQKQHRVYAPLRENDDFRFYELQTTDYELRFSDYRNTKIPPKEIFFPKTEVLYEFDGQEVVPLTVNRKPLTVVFGIRPCDARAISFLDKVFIEPRTPSTEHRTPNIVDPYYLKRRERTTIISLACNKPQITCFCTSVEGKPDDEKGSDIILFDLDEDILVKSPTEKGEKLIKDFDKWFKDAEKSDIEKKNNIIETAYKKLPTSNYELRTTNFNAPIWDEIHQKCLGCAICTYLCPTCHCFDITDETIKNKGKRIRCWDSCMFASFTLHASGHQPRPTYKERMRQRIMHKFNYCPENFKEIFCVGCGRCIRSCQVNLDLREVISGLVS